LVIDEHNKIFIKWFRNRVVDQLTTKSNSISENLRWLAHGTRKDVLSYRKYPTNGYYFYIKAHDNNYNIQNRGVILVAQSMHISNVKDNKLLFVNMSYLKSPRGRVNR